jgi:hypothetical protein
VSANYVRDEVGLLKLGERGLVSTVWGPYYFSWFDNEQCRNPQAGYPELHLRLNRGRIDQVGTMKDVADWSRISSGAGEAVRLPVDAADRSIRLRIHSRDRSYGPLMARGGELDARASSYCKVFKTSELLVSWL